MMMLVQDAMTRDPITCRAGTNLAEATELIWTHDCGCLPVLDEAGKAIGIVTDRDMLIALGTRNARAGDVRIADVMTSPAVTCMPADPMELALSRMNDQKIRRLVVTREDGAVIGVLAMNDVVLQSGPKRSKGTTVTYEEVMRTLKGICGHDHLSRAQAVAA